MTDNRLRRNPETIPTRVTTLLGIRYPIVQGGLARVAFAELCAAVSNAGGLGQITTVGLGDADALRREIARVRALTDRPFAVNFPIGRTNIAPLVDVAIAEKVPAIALTAGNPAPYLRQVAGTGIKTIVLTAGAELARKAEQAGADIIATVGWEGGGHIGRSDTTTLVMVPQVVAAVRAPVLASGGIATGRQMLAALALGAEGVEMGTRFVATVEARAHDAYKRALVGAAASDTAVIKRSIGVPARALSSPWVEKVLSAEAAGAATETIVDLVRGEVNARGVVEGNLAESVVWAGQAAGLIGDVVPAGEIVRRLVAEAAEGQGRLGALFSA